MAEWAKKFTVSTIRDGITNLVWSYWPVWGAPIVSAALTYAAGNPLWIIFNAALFAFAAVALSLNQVSQWLATRTPANKVRLSGLMIGLNVDHTSGKERLAGIKLGVVLHNLAQFPIEARVDHMHTQIGNLVPSEAFFSRSVTMGQGGGAQFNNGGIDLSNRNLAGATLYGTVEARLSYGRPGKLKYPIEAKHYVAMKFDGDGTFVGAETSTTEFATANATLPAPVIATPAERPQLPRGTGRRKRR